MFMILSHLKEEKIVKQYPILYQSIPGEETLAYRKCGVGDKVLLLLHGNMSSSAHFQTLMEKLEQDFTIYAVDLRGFGDSTYNHGFDSLHELANDIKEFISLQGIRNPVIMGWSTGGGIAMEIAADLGSEVRGIILLSSVGIQGYTMFRKDASGAVIMGDCLLHKDEIAADPVQVAPALRAYESNDKEFFRYLWNLVIYHKNQPPAEDYELYLEAILKQRNLVDVDYSLVHFNVSETANLVGQGNGRAKLITCPVAIIHGEADMVVPVEEARKTKEFFCEQAQLHILDGLSHSIVTDDLAALTNFVRHYA